MRDDYTGMGSSDGEDRETLPKNVKPIHYDLTLEPNAETLELSGSVTIDLEILDDTTSVILNSVDLDVYYASVKTSSGDSEDDLPRSYNMVKQQMTIDLKQPLPANSTATILLHFSGNVRDGAASGCYRSSYTDPDGEKKYVVATHFEPVDARSVFPCFDEPASKASFILTLYPNKGMMCLGNMPVARTRSIGRGTRAVTFQQSPKMSTYLLCFVMGNFNILETILFRIPVRIFATPNQDIESGRFALELGARTLAFFEEKLGVPFPLPKTDLVAVPGYRGAMEHWGLVTFRPDGLLYEKGASSTFQKQVIANVVQHELAHQWFGNLVTMDFWDGIWLNEGFATWAAMYANDAFFPEWKMRQQFLCGDYKQALDLDSLRSSHPIEVPVNNAAEIGQIFDAISYSKGSSVLRMLASYIGEDVFLDGIRLYLNRYKYGNTRTTQLWEALTEVSDVDVEEVMKVWTMKAGHPVVAVLEDDEGNVKLKQTRFLRTGDFRSEHDTTVFPIPILVRTRDRKGKEILLKGREASFDTWSDDLVKINANHVGFFRTLYSAHRLKRLGAMKDHLSVEDRSGIVSDAAALAAAGHQNSYDLLSLLEKFNDETELVAWKIVIDTLKSLKAAWRFQSEGEQQAIRAFQRRLVSNKAHEVGWVFQESDDTIAQQLKALLFGAVLSAGDEKAVEAASGMFEKFRKGNEAAIHPNIRPQVFRAVLSDGGRNELDFIWKLYLETNNADLKRTALIAIGGIRQQELMEHVLGLLLTRDVPTSEMHRPITELIASKAGILAVWKWMQTDWDKIYVKVRLGGGLGYEMGRIVQLCTSGFSSLDMVDDIEGFFRNTETESFAKGLAQGLDEVRVKAKWIESGGEDVRRWLEDRGLMS